MRLGLGKGILFRLAQFSISYLVAAVSLCIIQSEFLEVWPLHSLIGILKISAIQLACRFQTESGIEILRLDWFNPNYWRHGACLE